MWQNKIEVIISKSRIILDAIESNLPTNDQVQIFHFDPGNEKALTEIPKINTLILDELPSKNISFYNMQSIINLTNAQLTATDIFLKKPLKLVDFLQVIKNNRNKNQIFCRLNYNLFYDEQMAKLFNQDLSIRFTEKENEVFKHLLLSKEYKITKDELFQTVWQYHPDSNSTTFETHMSRLKQKLPQDLLQVKSNDYVLTIKDLR